VLSFKHFTVAVHDLDESVTNYQARLGLSVVSEKAHNSIGNFDFVVLGYEGQTFCHLICPSSEESPIYRLMQDRINRLNPHGEGIYLLAFETPSTDAIAQQVEAGGGRVNRAPNSSNIWVHPLSTNFVLMELFERPGVTANA
jgi:catechol 2,3-dioxygenase-like lactoylglutathione lyase family enzyme